MKSRRDVWMPFYFGDYLKDTLNLTTEQHGAYLLLMAHYWTKRRPLPDDDQQLASITKLTVGKWRRRVRPILAEFFTIGGGVWRQSRIDEELGKPGPEPGAAAPAERNERLAEAGRKGAAKRWARGNLPPESDGQGHPEGQGHADGQAMKSDSQGHAQAMAFDSLDGGLSKSQSPDGQPLISETPSRARGSDGQGQGHADGQARPKPRLDDAVEIVRSYHLIVEQLWGDDPPKTPAPVDVSIARGWIQRGADWESVTELFERRLKAMHNRGDLPPSDGFRYFNRFLPDELRLAA